MAPQPAQQNISAINSQLRQLLLATGIQQNIPLSGNALAIGGQSRVKLQNIGVATRLRCLFTFTYTATATAQLSKFGFLNAISNISLTDFTGTPRINASAAAIFMTNARRYKRKPNSHKPGLTGIGGTESFGAASTLTPNAGLATGSPQTAQFFLDIPIAFDPDGGDLRGALPLQSNVGEAYVSFTTASIWGAANDDTKAFAGAATITPISASVDILEEYILPQPSAIAQKIYPQGGGFPIPPLDTNTVNEIITVQVSNNIIANSENLIPFPNTRMINSINYRWFNNSVQGGTTNGTSDIQQHRIVVNGNNPILTYYTPQWAYLMMREQLGFDLGLGAYIWDFIGHAGSGKQPWQTAELGNIQLGLTPQATVNGGNTFIEFTTESFYSVGTPLGSIVP